MDTLHCRNCGTSYLEGQANYCVKCGSLLPSKVYPEDELKQMEKEPRPYEVVRFVSFMISFVGWVWLVLGWIAPMFLYSFSLSLAQSIAPPDDALPFYRTTENLAAFITFMIGAFNTLTAIGIIAYGQLFSIILDIRDDMHITSRLVRRFGLMLSEKN